MGSVNDHIAAAIATPVGSINDKLIAFFSANYIGSGSPEGVVTAPVGSRYQDMNTGGSGTSYIKASGTGNTGWVTVDTAGAAAFPMSGHGALTTTDMLSVDVTADTQRRFILNADGTLEWGSGALAQDTNLYRAAADRLQTDDIFVVGGSRLYVGSVASGLSILLSGGQIYHDIDTINFRAADATQILQLNKTAGVTAKQALTLEKAEYHAVLVNNTAGGAITIATQSADIHKVNMTGNVSGTTLQNAANGQIITLEYVQDGPGGRTYVWPSNCWFAANSAPSDTTASTRTSVTFRYDSVSSLWIEIARAVAVPIA